MLFVVMYYEHNEALSWKELQARHRSGEADKRDETPDVDAVGEPAGETEEHEPPAEPRAPAAD